MSSGDPLDELYREHPREFVARRDQVAKELRGAGEREEAERVRKLKRPTVAAWLINRVALESPSQLEEFADASRRLEDAQRRALEEREGAAEWRAAAARENAAIGAIVGLAEGLARDSGDPPGRQALERVGETLRAASADSELRERILAGRLERERSAATLGPLAPAAQRRLDPRAEKRRQEAQARRELEQLETQLGEATAREERLRERVEEAAEALRRQKESLAEAKREATKLRRQVKAAERRVGGR